jgi:CRP/FNR family transcriptional regulator, dissimilatory nitrate respiration regulator
MLWKAMDNREEKGGGTLSESDWRAVMSCPLFSGLPAEKARSLVTGRRVMLVEPRRQIFTQGERAEAFYVVLDGWVKLYRMTPAGDVAVVGVFARGESFAEPVMFLGGRYPASAEAASAGRLLVVDVSGFDAAMSDDPSLSAAMLASILFHTDRLAEDIAGLKRLASAQRVADFLIRQIDAREGAATLVLPHDKALLAARLGMTPETLSRAFAALRRFGVEIRRERVSIADVSALRAYAGAGARASVGESP